MSYPRTRKLNPVLSISFLLTAIVGLSGCATTYVPDAGAANPKAVPDVPTTGRIALINAQPATESLLIGNAGAGRTVYGDLHTWTAQAILALKKTLEKKGVSVTDAANKSLKVSITKVALTEAGSGWAFRCTVNFNIETSDGQIATLVADDTSWKYLNACDGVIPKVVLAALRDEKILKLLASP